MNRRVFYLKHETARRSCAAFAMEAPEGWSAVFSEPRRNSEQNAKFHAQISEIAEVFRFNGRRLDDESMKRLLVDQFKHETVSDPDLAEHWRAMDQIEMMPSLDGARVIVLGPQTRRFPKALASAFIEWLNAWAAEHVELEEA